MKKKETVNTKYVKKKTMLIVAIICLSAGFFSGIIYQKIKTENSAKMVDLTARQSISQKNNLPPRQSQQTSLIPELEQKVSANPDNPKAWEMLGNLYFDTNQIIKAISAYKKHLELNPSNANVWTDLGIMYRSNSQSLEAITAFDKAIEINPRHEQSRFNKGVVLFHDLNNQKAAIQIWKELVEINPLVRTPDGKLVKDMIKEF